MKRHAAWWLAAAFCAARAEAPPAPDPVWDGLLSSFSVDFDQLLKEPKEPGWAGLFDGFSGNWALDAPFLRSPSDDATRRPFRRVQGSLRYTPMTYWFAKLDAFYYLDDQAPWEPDFTYGFGYDDWHPYTLSLVYDNQGGNRFRPDRAAGEVHTHYLEGTYTLGWRFLLADELAKPMLLDLERDISCQIAYNFTPRYQRAGQPLGEHQQSATLSCNYPIYGNWRFSFKLFHYPDASQQQPWNPDYTYELGYADWLPGGFSVQYKNYAANRYPWNSAPGNGGLKRGGLYFSWNWKW